VPRWSGLPQRYPRSCAARCPIFETVTNGKLEEILRVADEEQAGYDRPWRDRARTPICCCSAFEPRQQVQRPGHCPVLTILR
jgi:hypothetical protein